MPDLGGSSNSPLRSSPCPARPMPIARATTTAAAGSHLRRTRAVPASVTVNSPVMANTIASRGSTKVVKWSNWVSPATANRAVSPKHITPDHSEPERTPGMAGQDSPDDAGNYSSQQGAGYHSNAVEEDIDGRTQRQRDQGRYHLLIWNRRLCRRSFLFTLLEEPLAVHLTATDRFETLEGEMTRRFTRTASSRWGFAT